MNLLATIANNLFQAGAMVCGVVGLLVIWRRISDVRETDRQRKFSYAANPSATNYPPKQRDYEAEYLAMKERAETAEWAAAAATERAEEAESRAAHIAESALEEATYAADEAREATEGAVRDATQEMGEALADAANEAERHWDACLNEIERNAAWAEHWQRFDKPVLSVVEAQAQFWAGIRARRKARIGLPENTEPPL